MKWIAVTSPSLFEGEALFLHRLFKAGVDLVHLRKPDATAAECAAILDSLNEEERSHIVIHQHFRQAQAYGLHGIHLNRRCPDPLPGYGGSISRSCHSLQEVKAWKPRCRYVFLSPIFDSISKQGYAAAFSADELIRAAAEGIIDDSVYALGGVTAENIPLLRKWRFGGAAMLGCVNRLASLPTDVADKELLRIKHCFSSL